MPRISKAKLEAEERKNEIIREHKEKLEKLFLTDNPIKDMLITNLIDEACFMYATLEDLKKQINLNGVKEKYKNGQNQYGFRDSVEVKSYNAIIRNYTAIIKQLNDMLPEKKKPTLEDEFDDFNNLK